MSDNDIVIDNENVILQDKIQEYLDDTKQASIAVGYFFISGFAEIMDHLKKMRLGFGQKTLVLNMKNVQILNRQSRIK